MSKRFFPGGEVRGLRQGLAVTVQPPIWLELFPGLGRSGWTPPEGSHDSFLCGDSPEVGSLSPTAVLQLGTHEVHTSRQN